MDRGSVASTFQLEAPIRPVPLAEQVYEAVRRAVMSGQLGPGRTVSEAGLAQELKVSRTPVREAVRSLLAEGFLVRQDDEVLSVPGLSERELRDLYAIRSRLEGLAAREAAERRSPEGIRSLEAANELIHRSYDEGVDRDKVVSVGMDFHQRIALLAGNQKNLELLQNVMDHIHRYRLLGAMEGRDLFLDDHAGIVAAIADGDGDAAEKAMSEHVEHALGQVLAELEHLSGDQEQSWT